MSVALVAFASAAIAAAQWGTRGAAPAAEPLVIEEPTGLFGRGGDIQLAPTASPLFTLELPSVSEPVGTGGEVALPEAIFAGGGSGLAYNSRSYASAAPGFVFGGEGSNGVRPRRSSSGGGGSGVGSAGGGFGFGGGAWGGVSGSAPRSETAAGANGTAARPSSVNAPKLGSSNGAGSAGASSNAPGNSGNAGSGSSGASGTANAAASGAPPFQGGAAAIPGAPFQTGPPVQGGPPVFRVNDGLTAGAPAAPAAAPGPGGPGSAPTPEPVTLLLVGLGAAALYGARRHFV